MWTPIDDDRRLPDALAVSDSAGLPACVRLDGLAHVRVNWPPVVSGLAWCVRDAVWCGMSFRAAQAFV
jgi:hypothetical protein